MRIVVDVSPLSHPRTGVGNYIRGSLVGIAEAGGHDIVAFAPASVRGRRAIESALDGVDVERKLPLVPAAPVALVPAPPAAPAPVAVWAAGTIVTFDSISGSLAVAPGLTQPLNVIV